MSKKPLTGSTPKARRKSSGVGKSNWRSIFLDSLGKIPNIAVACEQAHISRNTAYVERLKSRRFAKQWEEAIQRGIEGLEAAAWHRAHSGVKKPIWMKDEDGKPVKVDEVREPSDTLAIFLLKAHAPAKYREQISLGNIDGTPLAPMVLRVTNEELPRPKETDAGKKKAK